MLAEFYHDRSPFTVSKNTISTRAPDEILTDGRALDARQYTQKPSELWPTTVWGFALGTKF